VIVAFKHFPTKRINPKAGGTKAVGCVWDRGCSTEDKEKPKNPKKVYQTGSEYKFGGGEEGKTGVRGKGLGGRRKCSCHTRRKKNKQQQTCKKKRERGNVGAKT